MFVHIFLFRWKADVSDAQKNRAQQEIEAFEGSIDGLKSIAVGANVSSQGGEFGFGGVMYFRDENAFSAYVVHPLHLKLLEWLVPLVDAVECDIRANSQSQRSR